MTDSHPGGSPDPERTVYPCPACGRSADEVAGCTHCGRPVDVEAVAIMRLDLTIAGLTADLHQARQAADRIAGQLGSARAMRADAVSRLGAKLRAEHARGQLRPKAPRQETTPRAVQAVLFVLGGILLGSAAIVFTTVAWASFGIAGRGAILVLLTVLTLAVGPLALRRGLSGTAETFAALGLLLVVLDGYAAWYVDLGGVSESLAPATYAGLVAAVTTVAALGYASGCAAAGSGPIVGPPLTGFLTAQGVLPLLLADRGLWAAGWSVAMAIMAVVNLGWAVLIGRRGRHLVRLRQTAAVILACCWTAIATLTGLLGLSTGGASGALRAAAAVMLAAAVLLALTLVLGSAAMAGSPLAARTTTPVEIASAFATILVAGAGARAGAVRWPDYAMLLLAALASLVAVTVSGLTVPRWGGRASGGPGVASGGTSVASGGPSVVSGGPAGRWGIRSGPVAGALVVAGFASAVTAGHLATGAILGADALGVPAWRADPPQHTVPEGTWQLAVAVICCVLAAAVLAGRQWYRSLVPAAAAALALAVPAGFVLPWWVPLVADLVVAAGCSMGAVIASRRRDAAVAAGAAGTLILHAATAGLIRAAATAVVFGLVVLLAGITAELGKDRSPRAAVGAAAVATGLLALPGCLAACGRLATGASRIGVPWLGSPPSAMIGAVVGLVLATAAVVGLGRHRREYAPVAAVAVAAGGMIILLAAVGTMTRFGTFAAVMLLCSATATITALRPAVEQLRSGTALYLDGPLTAVGVLSGIGMVVAGLSLLPNTIAMAGAPFGWLRDIWAGIPSGAGVAPEPVEPFVREGPFAVSSTALTCLLLAVAALITNRGLSAASTWRTAALWASPAAGLAVLLGCVAADARWPIVPVVALTIGLGWILLGAVRAGIPLPGLWIALGLACVVPGLATCLPTRNSTLIGLGAVAAVCAACGVAGSTVTSRAWGWAALACSGGLLAFASARASGSAVSHSGYWVLLAAAALLVVSTAVTARWLARHGASGSADSPPVDSQPVDSPPVDSPPADAVVAETAAHVTATVALLLTVGSAGLAAGICALWSLAIGLTVLFPRRAASTRNARVTASLGCAVLSYWLGLIAGGIGILEAYTGPAAVACFAGGWLVKRTRPDLRSWAAYGTALAVGLMPSLVAVLAGGEAGWQRRLALGAVSDSVAHSPFRLRG